VTAYTWEPCWRRYAHEPTRDMVTSWVVGGRVDGSGGERGVRFLANNFFSGRLGARWARDWDRDGEDEC